MRLVVDEGGDKTAAIPRALVTVLERCGPVALKPQDLEQYFLFDLPEGIKARDVTSQLIPILLTTGLSDQDGEKVVRTSPHRLETWIKGAKDWMDGAFETGANAIKKIHHDAGHELFEIQAKDARYRLKEAEKKLQSLSLDFIDKPWDELNKEDAAGNLVYDLRLREALKSVGEVRNGVEWVYDPERIRAFRYSQDCLQFETQGSSPNYPLWKRLAVLQGFYSDLDQRRKGLLKTIQDIRREMDGRIPELPTGEKAFPLQV